MQIDRIKPGVAQAAGITLLPRQPQPVGIDLHQTKTALACHVYDLRQVVAHGGFAAGYLHVARAGSPLEGIHLHGDDIQRKIVGLSALGIGHRPGLRIAHGAGHVAAFCDLKQARAGVLGVGRAKTAVVGATIADGRAGISRIGRIFGARPAHKRRRGSRALAGFTPHGYTERAVVGAGFAQHHGAGIGDRMVVAGLYAPQAHGAEALGAA